ncbi:LysR substrate-binding domain-containing protein [Nonomuraea dietziae]|uniref:LysR substrate-binding domain-containing protein n=1 Tax=Nonomuraea dietziae TaxID=65515 RepID=UPI0031DF0DA3
MLLSAAQELQDEALRFANATEGGYRIGATNGPVLGGLVDRLAAAGPVSTYTSWSARELASMIAQGRLDYVLAGACGEGPPAGDITWITIAIDPVFVLLAEDHRLAGAKELALSDLADEQWAVTPGDAASATASPPPAHGRGSPPPPCTRPTWPPASTWPRWAGRWCCARPPTPFAQGLVMVPLAGAPLRWRQVLGHHRPLPARRGWPSTPRPPTPTPYGAAPSTTTGWCATPAGAPPHNTAIGVKW